MNPRIKSVLILLATLLIGGVLGALLQARVAEQRLERIAAYRSERGFIRYIERGIEPRDEVQREQIRGILSTAAARASERNMRHRQEMGAILDSTRAALSEVLTPAQLDLLERHLETRRPGRGPGPGRGHRRGPPPE